MNHIYLAILNITSWAGQCIHATHVYGKLILSENPKVTIDNIEQYNLNTLGEKIDIRQPLTLQLAKSLDKKSGGNHYYRAYRTIQENPDMTNDNMEYYGYTDRFDTFEEVVNAGILKWRELNLDCPFISLYEGEKYKANDYEPSSTVILTR